MSILKSLFIILGLFEKINSSIEISELQIQEDEEMNINDGKHVIGNISNGASGTFTIQIPRASILKSISVDRGDNTDGIVVFVVAVLTLTNSIGSQQSHKVLSGWLKVANNSTNSRIPLTQLHDLPIPDGDEATITFIITNNCGTNAQEILMSALYVQKVIQ